MFFRECKSQAIEELKTYGITSYISKDEEFDTEEEFVEEIISRASTASFLAFNQGHLPYDEFFDLAEQLEKFCKTYGYDFNEYCYGTEVLENTQQRGAYR